MSKMSKIFPNVYVKRITLDEAQGVLDVDIDFCLSFKDNPTAPAGLLRHCGIYKDFRILVVQITNPLKDAELRSMTPSELAGTVLESHKLAAEDEFGLNPTFSGFRTFSLINPILTKDEERNRFEISFNTAESFRPTKNISHLSYIFLTYLEDPHNLFDSRVGPPLAEKVIENGKVVETASAFFLPSGQQWAGPVHNLGWSAQNTKQRHTPF